MKANRIYQITRSKQLTKGLSNFIIKKVKYFKEDGIAKIYFYHDEDTVLTITSPQSIYLSTIIRRRSK